MITTPIARLVSAVGEARRIAVFTGAGISTDSGIPDYRGTGGQHERYRPVYFDEFVASETRRIDYWTHKAQVWPSMRDAHPGPTHRMIRQLDLLGRLHGVITQNIDGLHERSGVDPSRIVNLHGSNLQTECVACGRRRPAAEVLDPLADTAAAGRSITPAMIPACETCGGLIKPATVMFGQTLRRVDLEAAREIAAGCDLMLALGSTLLVHPAAGFPALARAQGATLAIVTRGETPYDEIADIRIDGELRPVSEAVLRMLGG